MKKALAAGSHVYKVLLLPLIVLLVSVWVPVRVATVESIAMVTAVEPL